MGASREQENVGKDVTGARKVIALYTERAKRGTGVMRDLIMIAWGDGEVVWSENMRKGGAPYRFGQIDSTKVERLLQRIAQRGIFEDALLKRSYVGADAPFTSLFIRSGDERVEMQSWHELSEDNDRVIATSSGLEPLSGRRWTNVLRREPAEYLYYRLMWAELRELLMELRPIDSKPIDGRMILRDRRLLWETLDSDGGTK
jgi:hypothetical protein